MSPGRGVGGGGEYVFHFLSHGLFSLSLSLFPSHPLAPSLPLSRSSVTAGWEKGAQKGVFSLLPSSSRTTSMMNERRLLKEHPNAAAQARCIVVVVLP